MKHTFITIRKIRLIQHKVIHPRGGVNRVMVFFWKLKLYECKRQLYVYIYKKQYKDNCK